MDLITLDYETYYDSDYTLKKLSTTEYIFDKRFEVILVSVKINGRPAIWMEEPQFHEFVQSVDWSKVAILAHHTNFDGLISVHHHGFKPAFWFDTMSMSRVIHGPNAGHSLEKLCLRYEVGEKGNETLYTSGLRRKDFTPEGIQRYGLYCCNDSDKTYDIFQKMIARGFPPSMLALIDTVVRMYTEPKFVLDEPAMEAYLAEEIQRKDELIYQIGVDALMAHATDKERAKVRTRDDFLAHGRKQITSDAKFARLLEALGVDAPLKPSPTKKDEAGNPVMNFAFAKSDPAMQELLEHGDEDIRLLAEARVAIKSKINESRTARMISMGRGGRALPVYLKVSGAHTHRLAGGDKVNWQNLERTNKRNPKKGRIRHAIRAKPGYKIVVADSGQIEARKTAYLAGHQKLLAQFAAGADVYSAFASEAFGRPVDRKKNADDEIPGHIGKCMVLGLGYGMGYLKFAGEMLKGMNGGPTVQFTYEDVEKLGIDVLPFMSNKWNIERVQEMPSRLPIKERLLHCAVANYFVELYRERNNEIVELHAFHEEVLKMLVTGHTGTVEHVGIPVELEHHAIRLPDGTKLSYRGLERKQNGKRWEFTYFDGRSVKKIYGGLVTENRVQALCRIIVTDPMIELHRRYNAVASMSHDEIIQAPRAEIAAEVLHTTLELMKVAPSWAPGLPLIAEGGMGDTYGSAK